MAYNKFKIPMLKELFGISIQRNYWLPKTFNNFGQNSRLAAFFIVETKLREFQFQQSLSSIGGPAMDFRYEFGGGVRENNALLVII